MQQIHMRPLNLITLMLATMLAAAPARADQRDELIAELKAKVAALQLENAELRAQLAGETAPPQTVTEVTVAPATADVATMQRELDAAREKTQRLEAEMIELEKLAGVSAKGDLIETAASLFETTTDDKAGTTTIRAKPKPVLGSNVAGFSEYHVGGSFSTANGQPAALPEAYHLELYTYGNPNRWLKAVKTATLRIDGQDFEASIAEYQVLKELKAPPGAGRSNTAGGVLARDERLALPLTGDLAERIGRAQTLKLILPRAELDLSREHIALVEALRLRAERVDDAGE